MGDRHKKGDKSSDPTIEEQLILRVPPAIAEGVRKCVKGKAETDLSFVMETDRKGEMFFEGKRYTVTLVDLPCVIESHKTLERRTFYKSADIHQMLLVEDPEASNQEEQDKFSAKFDAEWRLDSGLTKLTRHIRTKRWRRQPGFSRTEVEKVADELSRMKKGGPVPDRYELVEISNTPVPAALQPPLVSTAPSSSSNPPVSVAKPTASTPTPVIPPTIATTTAPEVAKPASSTSTPLPTPTTTPGPTKTIFKFGGRKIDGSFKPTASTLPATGTPTPSSTASPVPTTTIAAPTVTSAPSPIPQVYAQPPVTAQVPLHAQQVEEIKSQANLNAMAVDEPVLRGITPLPQEAVAARPSSMIGVESTPSAAPAMNSAEYEAKVSQRTNLARQKVAEEANLSKLNTSAQNEKNLMMKKRILGQISESQAKIKRMDEQLAMLDRILQQLSS